MDETQDTGLRRAVAKMREAKDVGDERLERCTPRRVGPQSSQGIEEDVAKARVAEEEVELKAVETSGIGALRPKMRRTLEHLSNDRD